MNLYDKPKFQFVSLYVFISSSWMPLSIQRVSPEVSLSESALFYMTKTLWNSKIACNGKYVYQNDKIHEFSKFTYTDKDWVIKNWTGPFTC